MMTYLKYYLKYVLYQMNNLIIFKKNIKINIKIKKIVGLYKKWQIECVI